MTPAANLSWSCTLQCCSNQPYMKSMEGLSQNWLQEHIRYYCPVVSTVLKEAKVTVKDLTSIAFTRGPVIRPLLAGVSLLNHYPIAWYSPNWFTI